MKKIVLIFVMMLLTFSFAHAQWVIDEGFEGTFPPTGWLSESATGDVWVQDDGNDYGPGSVYAGTYAAMYNNYDYSSGHSGSMTTPAFDLSSIASPQLDFYWWNNDGSSSPAELLLYSSTDGATFTLFETIDVYGSGDWVHYNAALTSDITHIKFEGISDYGVKNTFVDNFKVGQPNPYEVAVDQLTPDATILEGDTFNYYMKIVNLGFNADVYDLTLAGGAWTYDIRDKDDTGTISTIGIAAGASDTVIVKVTAPLTRDIADNVTFTATSQGDPGVYVSDDITTGAYAPYLSLFENFDACTTPDLPEKWSRIVQTTSSYPYVDTYSSATYSYSDPISVKMYNSSDTAAELMLVTPGLQTGAWGNVLTAMVRSSSGTQNILVGTMTDPNDPATFTLVQSFEVTSVYTEIFCPIDFGAKGTGYVAFKHGQDGTYDYYYIDDVAWEEIIPEPDMIIDETEHDFGMVDQGTYETWDVTIYNDGFGPLYFYGATVDAPFSVDYPDSIDALSYDVATVTLDATTIGVYHDVLEFHTNAVQDSTIDLSVIVKGADYVMEGFEETTFPPFGWENPGDYWARFMSDAYEGQGYARCNWSHDYDAILITPRLEIGGGDFMSFWWRNDNLYEAKDPEVIIGDTLWVEISNTYLNQYPVWEVIGMLTADAPMDEYEEAFIMIPDTYIGQNAKIRFRHRSELNSESRGVGLDNIVMPKPYLPVNFAIDPYYASDYTAAGNDIEYPIDLTNLGIQTDKFMFTIQDSSAIRFLKRDMEDFETNDGGWVATADWDPVGDWEWTNTYDVNNFVQGSYTSTPPPTAHSGTGFWGTVINGPYTDSDGNSYLSKTVDFSSVTDAYLTFWYWSDVNGSYDYCNITVNGDILLTIDTRPPTAWEFANIDLSTYDGMDNVQIVFDFHASSVVAYGGLYIDDLDYPGGGGPGPGPGPTGWPVTVSPPYLELSPGETGTFTATVSIPEDATLDAGQLSPVLAFSREENDIEHQVLVSALCHPKDPYEPNDLMAEATPADYDFVSDGAQIYYNADYRDYDIDIYTIDCFEGDIVYCVFELPEDETEFDGAILLVDEYGTALAYADSYAGGGSEYLQYRIQDDGTYYWILGKWDVVLGGKDTKKDVTKGINTTYYTVTFDLIPSPEVAVEPESITVGLIAGTGGSVSDELYISNIANDPLAENLSFNIESIFPGYETYLVEEFEDPVLPIGWTQEYVNGTVDWTVDEGGHSGNPSSPYEGNYNALFYSGNYDGYGTMLVTPELDLSDRTSCILDFWHAQVTWSGDQDTLNVYYKTSPAGAWTLLESYTENTPSWTQRIIDLPNLTSTYYIAFEAISGYGYGVCIDNVVVSNGLPWCSVSPLNGSVAQGNTKTVTVTCNSDDLDPGMYEAMLVVHNDALLNGASDIDVPLTFYISEEAGGLQGTVTFNGEPVDSVRVKVGSNTTYTDEYGFYCFEEIPSGIYDVFFYKDGFQTYVAPGVYLDPGWTVLLDAELVFDGPVPENFSAEGISLAVELDWDKPQTGGGGGGTQVDYVFDDGSFENGWAINPTYDSWLGNLFPVDDGGEITSFQLYGDANVDAGTEEVTIDVYDEDRNLIGTTDPFFIPADDWVTVPVANIPFTGEFYAMVHWNNNSGETNFVGFDENGTYATSDLDWYMSGGSWQLLHVAASSDAGVFGIRATAMVRGRNIELAYDTYQLGKEPEVKIHAVDTSNLQKGQRVLSNVFAQSGHTVDTGSYEVSHYTFNGDKELGFKMPRDITLLGYNVYELTKGLVAFVEGENNTSFIDDIVAVGEEYTYWVTAVYEEGESGPSNTDTAIPLPPAGGWHETFDVDWHNTGWTTAGTPNNWLWSAGYAYLYWSPQVENYDMSFISPVIELPDDPLDVWDLTLSMYIDDYSEDTGEIMEIWIIHDAGEDTLWTWDLDVHDDFGVSGGSDLVIDGLDIYAGQDVQLKFRSHGADTYNFNYWYLYDIYWRFAGIPPVYGALEGTVTDGAGNVLEGVAVTANAADYNPVYTNDEGFYEINPMAANMYDVQYYKEGYAEIWYYDVEIEEGVTTELNVALGNPTMDIDPTVINATVPVGGTIDRTITVSNNGNAPLDWGSSIEDQTDLKTVMLENSYYGPAGPSEISDCNPNNTHTHYPTNEEIWDILFNYDVETATGGTGIAGAEFGNGVFLAAEWGYESGTYRTVYKLDVEGNLISSWIPTWAPSSTGLRDMAFDGEYFYAGTASTTIYQFDEDGNLIGTISSPVNVRSIAYDSDNDAFWVNNWDDDMKLIDRSGSTLNTISSPPSMYGCAYDNISAGGPYLWFFTGTSSSVNVCQIEQFSLSSMSLTGVSHSVSDDLGAGIAGGLFTSGDIVPGTWVLGGLRQGTPQIMFGYELCPYASWISMDPTSGIVDPSASQDVTVTFNACDDPAGTIHTCNIVFESPQGVGPVTVPVTLMVGIPDYGTLSGTVTAATGGAPIEGALITATGSGTEETYTTYTNALGEYTIPEMIVGTYAVDCTADGYNPQTVNGVTIVVDQTTVQNFGLTAPVMVVNPTVINVNVAPGSTLTEYITIQNTGDGPMDFIANLYDYGKTYTQPDYSSYTCDDELIALKSTPATSGPTSFNATQTRDDVTIQYQTGYDDNGVGTTGVFNAICAARFTADELASYYDTYQLTQVNIHVRSADFTNVTLKVYEGGSYGNAGTEVYSQDITSSVLIDEWTNVTLTTPIPLVSGNEYWIGYSIDATADHPCSVDAGPMTPDKGAWIYYSGAWQLLPELNATLDYNWCIQGILSTGSAPWISIDPTSGTIPAGDDRQIAVMLDATELSQGDQKTASIEFLSDPNVGSVSVPVIMNVTVDVSGGEPQVKETKLLGNFPNPMLHSTTFKFSLKDRSQVKLSVYNLKGQLVETLLDTELDPDPEHAVVWNGTAQGKALANGIYFYKLETNSKTFLKKMILMK